jgi:hypothetical protein
MVKNTKHIKNGTKVFENGTKVFENGTKSPNICTKPCKNGTKHQ